MLLGYITRDENVLRFSIFHLSILVGNPSMRTTGPKDDLFVITLV